MSLLSQLPKLGERRAKRVGRGMGSGKGSKSTRGITRHQKSKTTIPLHFEGGQARLVKKYPLLRGKGKNKSVQARTFVLPVEKLNLLSNNEKVDLSLLLKKNMIPKQYINGPVKIVGGGKLEKKLTVRLPVSQSAQKAIEKAGGTLEQHAGRNR